MAYAIIRGKSGRRHEVDFGSSLLRVEVHASEETVEITAVRLAEGSCLGDRLIDWVCGGRWAVST